MTAHISRIAGAILLEDKDQFFLVGNTKTPCDWQAEGFESPTEIDAVKQPVLQLIANGNKKSTDPVLIASTTEISTETLAQTFADRFLIRRNGSVSDRLWRIVTGENDDSAAPAKFPIQADWLVTMPSSVWEIVRDTALKCL